MANDIRPNPFRQALDAGRAQIGTWLNLVRNPAMLSLLKSAGLDYARVDMEHSSPSMETVADMAVLSRALGFPIVVRPPQGNREWITRLLDSGVWNLHVPQVDTPEIAFQVAQATRYAPRGMRGMMAMSPGNDFAPLPDLVRQFAFVNDQVHVTAMLESPEAFRHLDAIVATPGIDAFTLGPTDLAQELGVLGKPEQGGVIDEHRDRVIEAAKRHGKQVAMLVQTLDEAERWLRSGVQIIAYSSEVAVVRAAYAEAARRLHAVRA